MKPRKILKHFVVYLLILCFAVILVPPTPVQAAKKITPNAYAKKYIKTTKYKLDNCYLVKYENKGTKAMWVSAKTSFYKDKNCKKRIKIIKSSNAIMIYPKSEVYAYFDTNSINEYEETKVSTTYKYAGNDFKVYNPKKAIKLTYDLSEPDEDNYYNFNIDIENKTKDTLVIGMILIVQNNEGKIIAAKHIDGQEIFLHAKTTDSFSESIHLDEEPAKLIVNSSIYY